MCTSYTDVHNNNLFHIHITIISTEGQDLIMNGGGGINNNAIIYLRRESDLSFSLSQKKN